MKRLLCLLPVLFAIHGLAQYIPDGAWVKKQGSEQTVLILNPHYFTITTYDQLNRRVIASFGGTCTQNKNTVDAVITFNINGSAQLNNKVSYTMYVGDNKLSSNISGKRVTYDRMDFDSGTVNGVWMLDSVLENNVEQGMDAIKTIKLISATRFQCVEINTTTGALINTFGGSYVYDNGLYVEHIEFNSADNTRVGKSLNFRGYLSDTTWKNSGKNMNGDMTQELWIRMLYPL